MYNYAKPAFVYIHSKTVYYNGENVKKFFLEVSHPIFKVLIYINQLRIRYLIYVSFLVEYLIRVWTFLTTLMKSQQKSRVSGVCILIFDTRIYLYKRI